MNRLLCNLLKEGKSNPKESLFINLRNEEEVNKFKALTQIDCSERYKSYMGESKEDGDFVIRLTFDEKHNQLDLTGHCSKSWYLSAEWVNIDGERLNPSYIKTIE